MPFFVYFFRCVHLSLVISLLYGYLHLLMRIFLSLLISLVVYLVICVFIYFVLMLFIHYLFLSVSHFVFSFVRFVFASSCLSLSFFLSFFLYFFRSFFITYLDDIVVGASTGPPVSLLPSRAEQHSLGFRGAPSVCASHGPAHSCFLSGELAGTRIVPGGVPVVLQNLAAALFYRAVSPERTYDCHCRCGIPSGCDRVGASRLLGIRHRAGGVSGCGPAGDDGSQHRLRRWPADLRRALRHGQRGYLGPSALRGRREEIDRASSPRTPERSSATAQAWPLCHPPSPSRCRTKCL